MEDKNVMHTGTTTIGIVCRDGIILAADKRATLGGMIVVDRKCEKVLLITEDIALTTAGTVSDIQLLVKIVKAQLKLETIRREKKLSIKAVGNLLASLIYSNIRKMSMITGVTGFLMAGKDATGFTLFELGMDGSLTKFDTYVTNGSGMMFALGVLENEYKKGMSVEEGIKLAVKVINAAIQRDTASGNGIDIVTITKDGAKKVLTKEVETRLSL